MTGPAPTWRELPQPVPVHPYPDGSAVVGAAGILAALGRFTDGTPPPWDVRGVRDRALTETRCLIPDFHDELVDALAQIEEVLLRLAAWEEDNADDHARGNRADPTPLPVPLAGHAALDALNRVQDAVVPTQTRTDHAGREIPPTDPAARTRLHGTHGPDEHRPLRLVTVARSDVDTLAAAARVLGHALAVRPASELTGALHDSVRATLSHHPRAACDTSAAALVETVLRAHRLLDLTGSDDAEALCRRLAAGGPDVVLTAPEEAAYHRLVDRATTMWTSRDPVAGWLY